MSFEVLTDAKREEFRKLIEAELAQKKELLRQHGEEISELRENTQDPLDAASVVEEHSKVMAEIKRLETRINELRRALNNFENFGYCESCDSEIPVKRLEFNFATTMCINCKSIAENKQKQFAG